MTLRDKLKFWILLSSYVEMVVRGTSPLSLPAAIANSLQYLKAFGKAEQGLPAGYTAIQYVENTSGTYVDLDVAYNDENSVLSVTATAVNNINYVFTARDSSAMQGIAGTSTTIKAYIDPVSLTSTTTKTAGHKYNYTLTANNGNATFKTEDLTAGTSDTQTTVYTVSQTQPTAHLCLFGNTYGNVSDQGMQIFGASYYVNGVAVRKLIPARKGATIGLFDLVSRRFFAATQGSLMAGLDTTLLPRPDAPLDIVCNNGALKADLSVTGTVETIKDALNNTATCENLFSVDTYTDVQSIIDGVVTHKIGFKVFDGTEKIYTVGNSTIEAGTKIIAYTYEDIGMENILDYEELMNTIPYPTMLITHFSKKTDSDNSSYARLKNGEWGAHGVSATSRNRYLVFGTNQYTTAASFKNFLSAQLAAGTPVIVAYPLETETTESVAGQTLQVQAGDNIVEITQASLNSLELEAKYKKQA